MILLPSLGIGFGNLTATAENTPPGSEEARLPDGAEMFVKAATDCCGTFCHYFCCMCCIQVCTKINNQCATAFTQLCVGLGCYSCFSCCCSEICCCCGSESWKKAQNLLYDCIVCILLYRKITVCWGCYLGSVYILLSHLLCFIVFFFLARVVLM